MYENGAIEAYILGFPVGSANIDVSVSEVPFYLSFPAKPPSETNTPARPAAAVQLLVNIIYVASIIPGASRTLLLWTI